MAEITNPKLIKAIRALGISDNPKTREAYYNALLDSTLLVPVADEGEPGEETHLEPGSPVNLVMGYTSEDEPLLLAFTDVESMLNWQPEGATYITIAAPSLFRMLGQQLSPMLMLNIAGKVGGEITPEEMSLLAQDIVPGSPESIEAQQVTDAMVGIAPLEQRPSSQLVSFLRQQLKSQPGIRAAYLFSMVVPPDPPHTVLGVEFADTSAFDQIDAIMRWLASSIPPAALDEEFSLIILSGGLLDYVSGEIKPIYQQAKG